MQHYKMNQQATQQPIPHNGQTSHNKRRCSKVPVRELPEAMPKHQHPTYPQLYCVQQPQQTCYKWDCIILDLDRTIIHGKRLSVKRWRKYVENGTIPSLAENQLSKWHRHIHRKGHQMHPFIRGRTMIYYRPFTWHLLAVLDYLKSHFGTKIIICTKAGEHYAASVLAALISNFTSANPDLIDDVYNFHDLHDDPEDEGKPKKPFRLICNRHNLDPKKTLIVDDNATSWFGADRLITNFWMPPCYGYQIHDIDNELQLLCKYLWDPIQQNHLKKKKVAAQQTQPQQQKESKQQQQHQHQTDDDEKRNKCHTHSSSNEHCEEVGVGAAAKLPCSSQIKHIHIQQHSAHSQSQMTDTTDSLVSPNSTPKRGDIILHQSPKSISSNTLSPKNPRYLTSPKKPGSLNGNSPKNMNELQYYPATSNNDLQFQQSISSSYSISMDPESEQRVSPKHHISNHNQQNALDKISFSQLLDGQQPQGRVVRNYNVRKYKESALPEQIPNGGLMIIDMTSSSTVNSVGSNNTSSSSLLSGSRRSGGTKTSSSPKQAVTKTKKKVFPFLDNKSRGSKKMAKNIGK